jgi:predicted transcriptional regulator
MRSKPKKAAKLSRLELQVMEILWSKGPSCVRDIIDGLPHERRPAYTTIQTIVHRLEVKKAVHRASRVGNVFVFEATIGRNAAHRKLIDEFLSLFGGSSQPVMTHLIESGQLSYEEYKDAEKIFKEMAKKGRSK